MTVATPGLAQGSAGAEYDGALFDAASLTRFAACYPEQAHSLHHSLAAHPLLEREALAELAMRLPEAAIEYNRGDLPVASAEAGSDIANGLSIADTIRNIDNANSWAVLKNIEQNPAYRELLLGLLETIRSHIEACTGEMLTPQGFVFLSSPEAVTPYHFDPEHNILLQLQGSKTMTQFPPGDTRFARPEHHEKYHHGDTRNLPWSDHLMAHGTDYVLSPGDAVYVPVMAPHFVRNGPEASLSLSITWRSAWSYEEAEAHGFNSVLRRIGFTPVPPRRYPGRNRAKALGWKLLRRTPWFG
ncbi:MAG: cupin-like domain-containing protein [Pseudomonadota bacterium]